MGLSSCTKETVDPILGDTIAQSRSANSIDVEIVTSTKSVINLAAHKIAVAGVSGENFIVTVNPGTAGAQTFTATLVTTSHNLNGLKVVINPGASACLPKQKCGNHLCFK